MFSSTYDSTDVPAIRLDLPTHPVQIEATDPGEVASQLQAAISDEAMPDRVTLVKLATWPPGVYYVVATTLTERGVNVPVVVGDETFSDLFAAAIATVASPSDPTRHEQSIRNVIEAAAVLHPIAAATTAQQINHRIKEVGGKRSVAEIRKQIEALIPGHDGGGNCDDKPTPQSLAGQFVQNHSNGDGDQAVGLVYSRAMGVFYLYKDHAWTQMSDGDMKARVTTFLQGLDDLSVTRVLVNDVIANAQAICLLDDGNEPPPYWMEKRSPLELSRPRLAQFSNGLLHLGKLLGVEVDADGVDLFEFDTTFHPGSDIRFINTNVLPYDFDEEAECPSWLSFLDEMLPRESCGDRRQELLQEFMGYTLLTGTSPFEKMLIMEGDGNNGKSTILNIWEHMLGVQNVSHVSFDLLGKDALLRTMVGKAANIIRELKHVSKTNEAILKQIISGEPLTIDRKYLDAMTVSIHAKLIVSCNSLPNFSDTTDGVWRRLIIMPLNVKIPDSEINTGLTSELLCELPGIFNWAVEGLRRLLVNGGFSMCSVCEAMKGQYRREANTVTEFLDTCTRDNPNHAVTTKGLYAAYKQFTVDNGRHAISNSVFGKEMKRLGYGKKRIGAVLHPNRPRGYTGLYLTQEGRAWAMKTGLHQHEADAINQLNFQQQDDAEWGTHQQTDAAADGQAEGEAPATDGNDGNDTDDGVEQ